MRTIYLNFKLTIFFLIVVINSKECVFAQKNMERKSEDKVSEVATKYNNFNFKILRTTCTRTESCYVIVYLDSKYFNENKLPEITKVISNDFNDKKGITLWLFDDLKLAESFALVNREYVNLASDTRGKYVRGGNEEFLLFSIKKGKLGDLSDVKLINLKKYTPNQN